MFYHLQNSGLDLTSLKFSAYSGLIRFLYVSYLIYRLSYLRYSINFCIINWGREVGLSEADICIGHKVALRRIMLSVTALIR